MPNGQPGVSRFSRYYSYRFTWSDGDYVWQNGIQPSPVASSDSEEEVEHKTAYWADYFKIEICVSLRERRLLPKELFTYKITATIAEFLGTIFDARSHDVEVSSTPPGSALPGLSSAV